MKKESYKRSFRLVLMLSITKALYPAPPLSIPLAYTSEGRKKTISYIGFIKFPPAFKNTSLEKCPAPRVYFAGNVTNLTNTYDNDGAPLFSYTCPQDAHQQTFDIVVSLLGAPNSNTIASLEVPESTSYLHYHLTAQSVSRRSKKYEWSATETRGVGPFTIPKTAVIIAEDADLIKGINLQPSWDKDGISILLPTILYLNVDKELFEYAHNAGLLASLDTDGFHKKEDWVILQSPKSRIFKTRVS